MSFVDLVAIVLAYLLGSLSFAVIVSKFMGMDDPRSYGSGNPGATNVLRSGKKTAAVLTLVGDALKGVVAVWLVAILTPSLGLQEHTLAFVAVAVLVGHMWPVFFGFKGGKGVATAVGVLFVLSWPVGLACTAIWLVMAFGLKISSLAALVATLAAPVVAFWVVPQSALFWAILMISALVLYRHKQNIQNLLSGKETKIGS